MQAKVGSVEISKRGLHITDRKLFGGSPCHASENDKLLLPHPVSPDVTHLLLFPLHTYTLWDSIYFYSPQLIAPQTDLHLWAKMWFAVRDFQKEKWELESGTKKERKLSWGDREKVLAFGHFLNKVRCTIMQKYSRQTPVQRVCEWV